ncbi:MAG: DUF305 domain-containing protein [Candidatus Eisenbacteria bacterium]
MKRLLSLTLLALSLAAAPGCGHDSADVGDHAMSGDDSSHGMSSGSMGDDMSAMNARMVRELGPADSSYDDRFIDMMIPHHQGAVDMARDARDKAQHPELRALADSIIASQEREVRQMEEWRREWYGH